MPSTVFIAGSSNPTLNALLEPSIGTSAYVVPTVKKFSDGETYVEIPHNVRGSTVYILQSTSAPANDNVMELLQLIDAAKRASAEKIIAVVPYYGYARQDRRMEMSRSAISAKLVADMIQAAGADQLVTFDLHSPQIQGFFDIPVTCISTTNLFASFLRSRVDLNHTTIVSPDVGGVKRARSLAEALGNVSLAIIDKRRQSHNTCEVMNVIGDVSSKHCIIVDDMVDTAGTLSHAAKALMEQGAMTVSAIATHGVLSGRGYDNINDSVLDKLWITDSIHQAQQSPKIQTITLQGLIYSAFVRMEAGLSVNTLQQSE